MPDTVNYLAPKPVEAPAPVVAPVVAPAAPQAIVQPVQATPAPVVAPVVEATPAPTVEAVAAPVIEAPKVETLLAEGLDKPIPAVEAVTPAPVETKTEGGQSAEPAPPPQQEAAPVELPKYDPFQVPEGIQLDQDRVGKFTELLSGLELEGKASHESVQQFGQKAVEFHINEVNNAVKNVTEYYQTAWEKQKTDWKEATLKDPEIGGNRINTTLDSVLTLIRTHGGTAEQQKEFRDVMETSGLGNHPAVIRTFANLAIAYKEGKPLVASRPVQETKSRTQTLYGNKS